MADIFWPPDLPQCPLLSGYRNGLANNTTSISMEQGPTKTYRRSTARPRSLVARFVLTVAEVDEKQLFQDFFAIVGNHLSFWFPDPENESRYILVKIKAESETTGVELEAIKFDLWRLNLQLEVWPNATRARG